VVAQAFPRPLEGSVREASGAGAHVVASSWKAAFPARNFLASWLN